MIKIVNVDKDSEAFKKGLRENDIIKKINGYEAVDKLDLIYYSNDELDLNVEGKGIIKLKKYNSDIRVEDITIKKCNNNCIFCFVAQLPKNCRNSLYLKDDDYRLSFMYGSYITLNNLREKDYKRIDRLKLSPLYISVHTVDSRLRNKIMRTKKKINIKDRLKQLIKMGILLHTQLVIMPGINDGEKLRESIDFLSGYYPKIQSITLVPVGLTKHRNNLKEIKPIDKKKAEKIIETGENYQEKFMEKFNEPFVYITDEFYVIAEKEFPHFERYELYDNGVGLYSRFKREFENNKDLLKKKVSIDEKIGVITSVDGYEILKEFLYFMRKQNINIDLIIVENKYFGKSVTVTGLLSGKDIKRELIDKIEKFDRILIPDVVLNETGLLLDDYTEEDMMQINRKKIEFVKTDALSLINKVIK
ncbi:MAG TPA: DUF512 domain-containing protein [Candidatus Mcinerneyibacterium sp.]|nr:DUF512 domain-containing protein [Candidatus Mcinerneyibacterium sp.]